MIVSCPRCRVSFSEDALPGRQLAVGDPCPYPHDGSPCGEPLVPECGHFVVVVRVSPEP
jgi:hypothetical protein